MAEDTPFRRYLRDRVNDAARTAIEENLLRRRYYGVEAYRDVVSRQLSDPSRDRLVLAFCAEKPETLLAPTDAAGDYYTLFRDFAAARGVAAAPNGGSPAISVCRLFPRRGLLLSPQLERARERHREWKASGLGIMPLTVPVTRLDSDLARALARANARECFGFLVFLDPNGSFAITHAGGDTDFRFSEWHRAANVRQFIALFDELLVRSDEFTDAVIRGEAAPDLRLLRELRARLRTNKDRPRPVVGWPTQDEIIEQTQPTGWPGVHVIGSFARQSTFYQTQARALNLAWALLAPEANLPVGPQPQTGLHTGSSWAEQKVAVIGDGIAARTFIAAALQMEARCELHWFTNTSDPNASVFGKQGDSSRYLHPTLYNWPHSVGEGATGSAEPAEAALPVLSWTAGEARAVIAKISSEFDPLAEKAITSGRLNRHDCWECRLRSVHGQTAIVNAAEQGKERDKGTPETFDVVVLAIGAGREWAARHELTLDYWLSPHPFSHAPGRVLIAGNGDGGLIDLAVTAISKFSHQDILTRLEAVGLLTATFIARLREIEVILDEMGRAAFDLDLYSLYESRLGDLVHKSGAGSLMRSGAEITYCAGRPQVFRPDTCALNRFVAYVILRAGPAKVEKRRLFKIDRTSPSLTAWFRSVDPGEPDESITFRAASLRLGTRSPGLLVVPSPNPLAGWDGPEEWRHNQEIFHACDYMREVARVDLHGTLNPVAKRFFEACQGGAP